MPNRIAELALELAAECGALDVFVLLYELHAFAAGREFTTREIVAHAKLPENARLGVAIASGCGGEIDPRRLASVLSQWRNTDVGFRYVVASIGIDRGWVLWRFAPVDLSFAAKGATNDVESHVCSAS